MIHDAYQVLVLAIVQVQVSFRTITGQHQDKNKYQQKCRLLHTQEHSRQKYIQQRLQKGL
jgi:hypothetical protein